MISPGCITGNSLGADIVCPSLNGMLVLSPVVGGHCVVTTIDLRFGHNALVNPHFGNEFFHLINDQLDSLQAPIVRHVIPANNREFITCAGQDLMSIPIKRIAYAWKDFFLQGAPFMVTSTSPPQETAGTGTD